MKTKSVILTATLLTLLTGNIIAQTYRNFKGNITSAFDKKPVAGVSVTIAEKNNPTNKKTTVTDNAGNYDLAGIVGIEEEKEIIIPEGTQSIGIEGKVAYYQKEAGDVEFNVYNLIAQKIFQERYQGLNKGINRLNWNSNNVAAGIYVYTITTKDRTLTGKTSVIHEQKNFDVAQTLESITQKEQQEARIQRETQALNNRQEQANMNMQSMTGTPTEYILTLEGQGIWGLETTFIASQDTTINQTVKDKINMPASVMEKYNRLGGRNLNGGGTVRTLTPLIAHFVVDTLDAVQKQFYDIFKQKEAIIKNAPITNHDPNYFKQKKFETGQYYPSVPNGMHEIFFGNAEGYAIATVVEYNVYTGIITRAASVIDSAYLSTPYMNTVGLGILDVALTKELMTGETDFGRNDEPDYINKGLFNSAVTHEGKDFKNPIDIIIVKSRFENPPNTKWDILRQMEIAPGWHEYLNKSTNGTATLITITGRDGMQYQTVSNKPLEEAMKEYVK